jgi:hypothetical protein
MTAFAESGHCSESGLAGLDSLETVAPDICEILLAQILDAGVSPRTKFSAPQTNRSPAGRPHCSGMPALRRPAK